MPDLNSLPPSTPTSAIPSPSLPASSSAVSPSIGGALAPQPSGASQPPLTRTSSDRGRGAGSPRFERRRSGMLVDFPSSGSAAHSPTLEAGMPVRHHHRQPSLGELHQELENEQEAQVNRLLAQIRSQQAQIASYERSRSSSSTSTHNQNQAQPPQPQQAHPQHHPPHQHLSATGPLTSNPNPSPPPSAAQQARSRTPSATRASRFPSGLPTSASPILRSHSPAPSTPSAVSRQSSVAASASSRRPRDRTDSATVFVSLGESATEGRDEVALAQAETASIVRENQMLKVRIRELEAELGRARLGPPSLSSSSSSAAAAARSAARGDSAPPSVVAGAHRAAADEDGTTAANL